MGKGKRCVKSAFMLFGESGSRVYLQARILFRERGRIGEREMVLEVCFHALWGEWVEGVPTSTNLV